MLKVRVSYGEIGDDNVANRWLYLSTWDVGGGANGKTPMGLNHEYSPYSWYRETAVGNPDVHWETVRKFNLGIDYSFLNGLFAGAVEVFRDRRTDIIVSGGERSIPPYYGATPPSANLGEVKTRGYELELRINKVFANQMRLWGNFSMTHAVNEVIKRDDPQLAPAYQKQAGYAINQTHAHIDAGHLNTYDQIYGSPQHNTSDNQKLPGDYYIVDFNADGVIDDLDYTPYGFSSTPQNTYNATIGFEWKGFSAFVQFYGVTNVTRDVNLESFTNRLNRVYDQGTWWSKDTPTPEVVVPRLTTTPSYYYGTQNLYDGSYIRLKNVQLGYTLPQSLTERFHVQKLRFFISGENLWTGTGMANMFDPETVGGGNEDDTDKNGNAYPLSKSVSFGLSLTL